MDDIAVNTGGGMLPINGEQQPPVQGASRVWTSLDCSNKQHRILAANAVQQTDMSADDVMDQEFEIEHILYHPVGLADEVSGEIFTAMRTILFTPDGTSIGFVSLGVYGGVSAIAAAVGLPPWNPPVRVRLERVKAKKVGHRYILKMIG